MALFKVLRFSHSGGDTDFYADEAPAIRVEHVQNIDLFTLRTNQVKMYHIGQGYRRMMVTFDMVYGSTIDKLEFLFSRVDDFGQPEVLTCYYLYSLDASVSLKVQMKRDDMKWFFARGGKLRKSLPVVFQEAVSTADTVAMPYSHYPLVSTCPGGTPVRRQLVFVNAVGDP